MKKTLILILVILVNISCNSLRLRDQNQEYKNVKRFNISDFKTYVFNICEKYGEEIESSKRFCECPDGFYDVAQEQKIRKVEELYLLSHRNTDLVLYLTTTSHKYIYRKADGFLNDPKKFKNNIVLNEIESIYIGRKDTIAGFIHFPSYKDSNDIILHFDEEKFKEKIHLTSANLATSENDYDISEEISLDSLFSQELVYKYQENMTLKFYKKVKSKRKDEIEMELNRIFITSKKGKVDILLGFDSNENLYKYNKMKVKYHPNFSLIQVH
jgi:uncharacterized protein (DUF488 family)